MLTQPTEGRKTIIRKNKPKHIWLTFLLMSPEGRRLHSIPWMKNEEGLTGLSQHKSRGKDNVRSDLESKLFFENVFKEKVTVKYGSYENFFSQSRFE